MLNVLSFIFEEHQISWILPVPFAYVFRQRLFENLRMLPHAPGVQMQAIPEDAVHEDSGEEDGEDPDKRISSEFMP